MHTVCREPVELYCRRFHTLPKSFFIIMIIFCKYHTINWAVFQTSRNLFYSRRKRKLADNCFLYTLLAPPCTHWGVPGPGCRLWRWAEVLVALWETSSGSQQEHERRRTAQSLQASLKNKKINKHKDKLNLKCETDSEYEKCSDSNYSIH